jgi:hypothetical protein
MSLWDILPIDCKLHITGMVAKMNFEKVLDELVKKVPKIVITKPFLLFSFNEYIDYTFVLFDRYPKYRALPIKAIPTNLSRIQWFMHLLKEGELSKYIDNEYATSIRWYIPNILSNKPIEYF